jgi:hypothetical protein
MLFNGTVLGSTHYALKNLKAIAERVSEGNGKKSSPK